MNVYSFLLSQPASSCLGVCLLNRFLEAKLLSHLKYRNKLTSRKAVLNPSPTTVFVNPHVHTALLTVDISNV